MPVDLPRSADLVVVGGGIIGASIAWQLASRKAGRVVLLERSIIAAGASGRTGALLRQHYTNLPEAKLAARSLEIFQHWGDVVGGNCGFEASGLIVTVPTLPPFEANIERMRRTVAQLRSLGVAIDMVDAAALREIDPAAAVDDISFATYESSSGHVDAVAATTGMAAAARRHGAEMYEGVAVTGLMTSGSRIIGVETSAGAISAPVVVLANGPWSVPLARTAGIDLPITSLRVQIAIFQTASMATAPACTYVDNVAGIFCRPWGPGRTMAGLGGGDQHDPIDPDACSPHNDPAFPQASRSAMARRFPAFSDAVYLHGHAGIYDMTPDAHPIIGPAGPDGLLIAAGFSGAGFKKGPAIGEKVSDTILSKTMDWGDLAPFDLARFASGAWNQPWSLNEYELASDFGHGF